MSEVLDYSMKHEVKDNTDAQVVQGVIVDISGGGARLVAKEHLEKNEVIKLKFMVLVLDEVMYFDLFARVLSSVQTRERRGLYEQRLEFMKISQDDRDKIIRYIFESERLARAKEAGK